MNPIWGTKNMKTTKVSIWDCGCGVEIEVESGKMKAIHSGGTLWCSFVHLPLVMGSLLLPLRRGILSRAARAAEAQKAMNQACDDMDKASSEDQKDRQIAALKLEKALWELVMVWRSASRALAKEPDLGSDARRKALDHACRVYACCADQLHVILTGRPDGLSSKISPPEKR